MKLKELKPGDKFRYLGDLSKAVYTLVSLSPLVVVNKDDKTPFMPGIGAYIIPVE